MIAFQIFLMDTFRLYIECSDVTEFDSVSGNHVVRQLYTIVIGRYSFVDCRTLIDSDIIDKFIIISVVIYLFRNTDTVG